MNEDILIKYIIGTSTQQEAQDVVAWINSSEANAIYYQEILTIWQHRRAKEEDAHIDIADAWQRFLAKRNAAHTSFQHSKKVKLNPWRLSMAAAALLICAFTAFFYIANKPIEYAAADTATSITLPDNSTIVLNKLSSIQYKKNFNKKERLISLTGEAFFDVTKDKDKPFRVAVDDIEVLVVGTSFNIRSNDDLTEVVVESGVVKVFDKEKNYTLYPKDKIIVDKKTKETKLSKAGNLLYQYYRTNIFVCDHTPLADVAKELSIAYNVTIQIENDLLKYQPLTNKFSKDEPIDNILKVIAETLNAEVQQRGNTYILR
jgi:transmembrane sensor